MKKTFAKFNNTKILLIFVSTENLSTKIIKCVYFNCKLNYLFKINFSKKIPTVEFINYSIFCASFLHRNDQNTLE